MIIYRVINKLKGMIYVGKTVVTLKRRWDAHCAAAYRGQNTHLKLSRAILKYGRDAFRVQVLEETDSAERLNELERKWIRKLGSNKRGVGYNMTDGGDGAAFGNTLRIGCKLSDEHKAAISAANKGMRFSPESIRKRIAWAIGGHLSIEHRKKIGDANRGKPKPPISEATRRKHSKRLKGIIPWHAIKASAIARIGTKRSLESRRKQGETQRRHVVTAETRRKISCAQIGKCVSDVTRKKMSDAAKKRTASEITRKKISDAIKRYWASRRKGVNSVEIAKDVTQIQEISYANQIRNVS